MCGLAISVTAAHAATFTVSNLNDAGAGSLRQAIINSSNTPESDTIDATGVNGTIQLTSPLPDLTDLALTGPGAQNLSVSGGGALAGFPRFYHSGGQRLDFAASPLPTAWRLTAALTTAGGGIYNGTGTLDINNRFVHSKRGHGRQRRQRRRRFVHGGADHHHQLGV